MSWNITLSDRLQHNDIRFNNKTIPAVKSVAAKADSNQTYIEVTMTFILTEDDEITFKKPTVVMDD